MTETIPSNQANFEPSKMTEEEITDLEYEMLNSEMSGLRPARRNISFAVSKRHILTVARQQKGELSGFLNECMDLMTDPARPKWKLTPELISRCELAANGAGMTVDAWVQSVLSNATQPTRKTKSNNTAPGNNAAWYSRRIQEFIEEVCYKTDLNSGLSVQQLFAGFVAWSKETESDYGTINRFGTSLAAFPYQRYREDGNFKYNLSFSNDHARRFKLID